MKAIVDRNTCIGCGLCAEICPAVFELDAESLAFTKVDEIPAEEESAARDAAESCPVNAIAIEE